MKREIYLDNSATTRICEEALSKYNEVSLSSYGNPSSLHALGFSAERELECARAAVRASVSSESAEVIFTASGSEANNLAIIGRALARERFKRGGVIISTMGEHASVSEPLRRLSEQGFTVEYLPTASGEIDFSRLEELLCERVILVTAMMVNNETGALYNIPKLSKAVKSRCPDAVLHTDATQSYLKFPFTIKQLGVDLLTVSSHKIEGPKGVGALIADRDLITRGGLSPIILGGGQEGGLRSGTENVPAVAAFGEAVRIGYSRLTENMKKAEALRAFLISEIANQPQLCEISPTLPKHHAPHIINLTLPGIKSETMLHFLSSLGIYVSSGSACSSNSSAVSSALTAYGRSEAEADCSIRISFSHRNTEEDVAALCKGLAEGLSRLARTDVRRTVK